MRRKFLYLYILFIFSLFIFSCENTETGNYPNGKLKFSIETKSGKKDGKSIWYFENGLKESEFEYKDGKLDGKACKWNFLGNLITEIQYNSGKKHGYSKSFNDQGKLVVLAYYKMDVADGQYIEYYPETETIKIKGLYKDGFMQGDWEFYDTYGRKIGFGTFFKGNGFIRSFYSSGAIKEEQFYANNKAIGKSRKFNQDGTEIEN